MKKMGSAGVEIAMGQSSLSPSLTPRVIRSTEQGMQVTIKSQSSSNDADDYADDDDDDDGDGSPSLSSRLENKKKKPKNMYQFQDPKYFMSYGDSIDDRYSSSSSSSHLIYLFILKIN